MNILEDLATLFSKLDIPVESAEFTDKPPGTYAVFTPISDDLDAYSDDAPEVEICSVRISLFTKINYILLVKRITAALLESDFTITDRRYINREVDTGYNHYAIDCEKINAINTEEDYDDA